MPTCLFFFKVQPILVMFLNSSLINSNQTITLTRSNANQTYQFICSSIGSRPDVSLSLYDTNSSLKISNNLNSIEITTCNINDICRAILQVNFQFIDASFNTMTSISCGTSSKTPSVPLTTSISRNTVVIDYLTTSSKTLFKDKQTIQWNTFTCNRDTTWYHWKKIKFFF
jgi:hypothetical protein